MKSSKRKAPKLTRAEIAAALRRREAAQKRTELRELVALAYDLGRKTKHETPIPAGRLLAQLRELREAKRLSKTNRRAAAYLALLQDTRTATISEIREAFTVKDTAA